jgi:hypothetical protein
MDNLWYGNRGETISIYPTPCLVGPFIALPKWWFIRRFTTESHSRIILDLFDQTIMWSECTIFIECFKDNA